MNKILQKMVDDDPDSLDLAKALEIAYVYRENHPAEGQKSMSEDDYFNMMVGKLEDSGMVDSDVSK